MTVLRQLSAVYLAAASAFVVAMAYQEHPALRADTGATARFIGHAGMTAAVATNDCVIQPSWKFARTESAALGHEISVALNPPPQHVAQRMAQNAPAKPEVIAHPAPRPMVRIAKQEPAPVVQPRVAMEAPKLAPVQPAPTLSTPPAETESKPALRPTDNEAPDQSTRVASAIQPAPKMELAPQAAVPQASPPPSVTPDTASPVPNLPPPSPAELVRVEQRFKDSLTSEMLDNFDLFLYVSKAASGPWAQRMYVFQKQTSGDLVLLYNWPVSTGREKIEFNAAGAKLPSFTPAGYYELDPKRFYPHYRSMQWNQPMPYAMFFNWEKDGYQTGLAIHAATGDDIALLGSRSSAGCIRLAPESARLLFDLIKTQYKGLAPRFAYDRRTGTMSNDGIMLHDANGHVQLAQGYKVLVFVEDYGGENVVAALF